MGWAWLATKNPAWHLPYTPAVVSEENIRKVGRLMDQDNYILIRKAKVLHTGKAKIINSPLPIACQMFGLLQERWVPASTIIIWENERHSHHNNHKCCPFFLLSPSFYCRAWHHIVWDLPLVSRGQLAQQCPLTPLAYPQPTGICRSGLERKPWCCDSTAQQWPKQWCIIKMQSTASYNLHHSVTVSDGQSDSS